MLITAGHFWLHAPHRFNPGGNGLAYLHGYATNSLGDSRFNNSVAFGKLSAVPNGATNQTAWILARRSGGMSSVNEAVFSLDPTGSMLSGVTASAPATFDISTNTPDGQLVSTVQPGGAPATFGVDTNTPELTASLSGVGSSDIGFSFTDALLGALGGMTVTADFGIDGTLTSYAVGHMEGTTADTGVTVDNIVTALESAILPVNIVKVNDYAVTGAGQSGNEWGPV